MSGEKKIYGLRGPLIVYPTFSLLMLLLFSVIAIISAVGTYKISIEGSKNLLETRAIDIAVNLGFTLEKLGFKKDLFPELTENEQWDDLAFLSLYSEDGTIVLHSNPHLIGRRQDDSWVRRVLRERKPKIHFSPLATGEMVFILDFPLRLHLKGGGQETHGTASKTLSRPYCLRVALHPYPAQAIVRRSNLQLVLIGLSLVILWSLSLFFFWTWKKKYRLEIRLREQERMAALGEMAAVLAHEIRNPLSSIKGFAQYHMEGETDPAKRQDMEIIVEEARRLEYLTSDLLAYARPTALHIQEFSLKKFCEDLARTLGPKHSDRITWDCDDYTVATDREKLMQISINLVQNALDALEGTVGGRVWYRLRAENSVITLEVRDNGPGIDEEIAERVCEPFVTTKTKGTGLGLAIVQRLVYALKGRLNIESTPGEGTLIRVDIPIEAGVPDPLEAHY